MALDALLAVLLEKASEEAGTLTLEEATLCALAELADGENEAAARLGLLARAFTDRFEENGAAATASRRRQPLLRALIEECVAGRAGQMQGDEVAFLCVAYELAGATRKGACFERVREFINPERPKLDLLRKSRPLTASMPRLGSLLHVVSEADFDAAPARQAQEFAGLAMNIMGRVLTHRGHLRVLGDIPDNCTVAVEQGDCYVDGYMLGNLAATGSCNVRGNVSGVIIARHGDVRMRDVINHATCISKQGRVVCMNALQPGMVFGFNGVEVCGEVRGGTFLGGEFRAGGVVTGGEVHVSQSASAARFARAGQLETSIVFRHTISHADYGELVTREAARLVGKAYRLRQRVEELNARSSILQSELDQIATNAVLYLAGGEQAQTHLQTLQKAERRLSFLDRIIAGVEAMVRATDLRLNVKQEREIEDDGMEAVFDDDSLTGLVDELDALEQEGEVEEELLGRRDELIRLQRAMRGKNFHVQNMVRMLIDLSDRASAWRAERQHLARQIATLEHHTTSTMGKVALVEKAAASGPLIVLDQLRKAIAQQPNSPVAERFRTPFARLLFRNIDNRRRYSNDIARRRTMTANEYAAMREELHSKHQLRLPTLKGSEGEAPPRVRACFDEGVRIFGAMHAFETKRDSSPCVCVTPQEDGPVTFQRGPGDTVERV